MKELKQALIYVTAIVLFWELAFEFVWEHRSFFTTALIVVIACLVAVSIRNANKNARQ